MEYVYDFLILLVWTAICAAFVYGLERVLELLGYRATRIGDEGGGIPPLPPE
jgi:hypothetical protein